MWKKNSCLLRQKIRPITNRISQTKSFCTAKLPPPKSPVNQVKRQPIEWVKKKKIARYTSDRGLAYRIYKKFKKLKTKETVSLSRGGGGKKQTKVDTEQRILKRKKSWKINIE